MRTDVLGLGDNPVDWERDERYRQLVELAPDGILIHDGERIVLANAAALRLAGATRREQVVGLPIETFLEPPYLKAFEADLLEERPVEVARPVRDTLHRIDGVELAVEVRTVAFSDHGRPSAHLIIRDITERLAVHEAARQVGERLQEAQRMELVGALAGGVAHEINNMLQVVLGSGEFLVEDPGLPDECRADAKEILRAGSRAAFVTRQLLAFGRRTIHRPEIVDLGAVLRDAEPVVRRLLDGQQLGLVVDAAPAVRVDAGQIQQVLLNLAFNARDAMPHGGTLTMKAGEVEVKAGLTAAGGLAIPPGRYGVLTVQDTGLGVVAAIRDRLFEPFFTTKPVGQGAGLGLSAMLGLVTQNDGFITVAAALRRGATFTVYLPLVPPSTPVEPRRDKPRVSEAAARGAQTILVVDDEPAVRSISARILQRGGWRVLQAADGAAALTLIAEQGPPTLLLTDVKMPGIGGAELARQVRSTSPALPILFMSGYPAEELQRDGLLDAASDVIQKPFTAGELVATVSAVIAAAQLRAAALS